MLEKVVGENLGRGHPAQPKFLKKLQPENVRKSPWRIASLRKIF